MFLLLLGHRLAELWRDWVGGRRMSWERGERAMPIMNKSLDLVEM
jgi:hypothetical protein